MTDQEACPRCGLPFTRQDEQGTASITYDYAEWSTRCHHPKTDGLTPCLALLSPLPVLIPRASLNVLKGDRTSVKH